jgi:hypothetical protein
VFEVGVNDIITNGTNWPWGANPMRGWEVVRAGPVCCEWRFWSYLRRTSDNAFHKWLKGWVYVRAWGSAGPFEIGCGVRMSNIVTTSGTLGGASNDTIIFDMTLLDGATTLQVWGGSADSRVAGIASTAFNTTTKVITIASSAGMFSNFGYVPGGVPVTLSGTVGTGIDISEVYWLSPYAGALANGTPLTRTRPDAEQVSNTAGPTGLPWAATTAYGVGSYVTNGNVLYRCITAGTSAGSGGPTGNGTDITDGTVHWTSAIADFTTQGSGTITFTPHCQCFAFCGQIYLDENAHRLWSGATRPAYEMAHDFVYLTTKSKAVPPYLTGLTPTADTNLWTASPGNMYFTWNMNGPGDNVGDDRIGWMMSHEVKLLYTPFDVTQNQNCRVIALTFAEQHTYIEDEAVGKIPIMNNGHLRNGTTYTNLGVCRPTERSGPYYALNTPNWLPPGSDGIYEAYNVFMASAHGPMPGYLTYLKSGDDLYREYMLHLGNMCLGDQSFWKQIAIGSITYQRLGVFDQERAIGWLIRWLGNTRHLMPAGDPLLQYWCDLHAEQALYFEAWRQNVNSVSNPGGVPAILVGPVAAAVPIGMYAPPQANLMLGWQMDIAFIGLSIEGWRNEVPAYASFCNNFWKNNSVDRNDTTIGGCLYWLPADYLAIWSDYPTDSVWPADWNAAWTNVGNSYNDSGNFFYHEFDNMPDPYAGCPTGLAHVTGAPAGNQAATNSYVNINTCALAMATIIDPTGHAATIYAAIRAIEYAYTPPLDFNVDPRYAIGPIGATG